VEASQALTYFTPIDPTQANKQSKKKEEELNNSCSFKLQEKHLEIPKPIKPTKTSRMSVSDIVPQMIEAAQEAYTSTIETDRGLRNIVLRTFHEHQQLMEKSDAQELVRRLGSLASDLVIYASNMRVNR
jgi:hypothetical protein